MLHLYSYSFQVADFLSSTLLNEQIRSIKEMSDHCANLKRVGPGVGEYLYDQNTMKFLTGESKKLESIPTPPLQTSQTSQKKSKGRENKPHV